MSMADVIRDLNSKPLPVVKPEDKPAKTGDKKPWELLAAAAAGLQAKATGDMETATTAGDLFPAVIRRLTCHYIRIKGFGFFTAKQMPLFRHIEANFASVLPVEIQGHFTAYLAKPDQWLPVVSTMVEPFGFVQGGNERGVWWSCRKSEKSEKVVTVPV